LAKYRANFDFESSLFDPTYDRNHDKYKKINYEFEYLALFELSSQDILLSPYPEAYPQLYIDWLKQNNFCYKIEKDSGTKDACDWWGDISNTQLEKMCNSKLFAHQFCHDNLLSFPTREIIQNYQKFMACKFEGIKILKSPWSVAGRGNIYLNGSMNENLDKRIKRSFESGPHILESRVQRFLDLGLIVGEMGIEDVYLNSVDRLGQYKGSIYPENQREFVTALRQVLGIDLIQLNQVYARLFHAYRNNGTVNPIQVDAFAYKDKGDKICLVPINEVNCRKTMGIVAKMLKHVLSLKGHLEFIILPCNSELNTQKIWDKSLPFLTNANDYVTLTPETGVGPCRKFQIAVKSSQKTAEQLIEVFPN